ncbi:MAG: acyltransferase family protein [Candidatus Sericytochromatia bacterium]|nr:acyltransferase family protein [Candidatus Sericytochromatia bacterium]
MSEKLAYRPEIDGLRAISVLAVILFHGSAPVFRGGFIGVDVFFVISGFLITSIILSEITNRDFSLKRFYERRARRILPALFLVLLACLPFAWLCMNVFEQSAFFKSMMAVSFFSSNFFFWQESNYFGPDTNLAPLLHTWSLAVEEQYYLFFPLLMIFAWQWGKKKLSLFLVCLSLLSLGLSEWGAYNFPVANFYLLHGRLWEILAGSLISFYLHSDFYKNKAIKNTIHNGLFSFLGLFLILFSIFAFNEYPPFPNLFTLVPVLGAALIILFADSKTLTGRLLSHPICVQLGLISYSAYLWHQPIFAFARISKWVNPSESGKLMGLGICALILGYLSWKYVEQPFRDRQAFSAKFIFKASLIGCFAFCGLSGLTYLYTEHMQAEIKARLKINLGLSACDYDINELPDACKTAEKPDTLIWGDSFAMHLVDGILASNPKAQLIQATKSACGPVLDIAPLSSDRTNRWGEECIRFNQNILKWLKQHPEIRYVVLSSIFQNYFDTKNKILYNQKTTEVSFELVESKLRKTLNQLTEIGVKPILFSPPPKNGENLGSCIARPLYYSHERAEACKIYVADYHAHYRDVIRLLKKLEHDYPVVWLELGLCHAQECTVESKGVYIYRDDKHLSIEGSKYLGQKMNFAKLINESVSKKRP